MLADFFSRLVTAGATADFHPHPFTEEVAEQRCRYDGSDVYVVALVQDIIVGYGMLRGWDAGFQTPSLGVAVDRQARGLGVATALVHYLHVEAKRRCATRIRLKVYPKNESALRLYRAIGYDFAGDLDAGQLVGFFPL
jgi:ribosomal protein S18 acetylase RimI-like enzyme